MFFLRVVSLRTFVFGHFFFAFINFLYGPNCYNISFTAIVLHYCTLGKQPTKNEANQIDNMLNLDTNKMK